MNAILTLYNKGLFPVFKLTVVIPLSPFMKTPPAPFTGDDEVLAF